MTEDEGGSPTVDDRPKRGERRTEPKLSGGRYRELEPLGRGGMGEVLVAHDEIMGREVAIKRMLEDDPSPEQVDRFLREARVQGRLDHPAIPPVYELARDHDGRPFFVMKRLVGTTLSEILRGVASEDWAVTSKFPRERLLRAFAEVCLAVELAHTRGVIHRDLKPANIMLGDFGEVYVLDWGIAKVVGVRELASLPVMDMSRPMTMPGVALGTRSYMAPEQLAGREIDHRVDVYALGCVLFEILTGSPLHAERREDKTIDARPSQRAPDRHVPPELDALCVAACAHTPGERLASARELGAAVQRFLDGDRDVARRRQLATEHFDRASAALAATDSEDAQRVAMQEAGRALALDPTLAPAAKLVGRLMLEPPRTTPPEVERSLREDEVVDTSRHAPVAVFAYAAVVFFMLLLLWLGMPEPQYAVGLIAVMLLCIGVSLAALRWAARTPRLIALVLGNACAVGLFARMFSPYVIAPGTATLIVMALTGNPLMRADRTIVVSAILLVLAMLVPAAAESLGWLSSTYERTSTGLLLTPPAMVTSVSPGLVMSLYSVALVAVAAVMSRMRARVEADSRRRLHVQAWRLRQLVEAPSSDR